MHERVEICSPAHSSRTGFEKHRRKTAGNRARSQVAEVLFLRAFIKQTIANERNEVFELVYGENNWISEQWIDPSQHGFNRPQPISQIPVDTGTHRTVRSRGREHIKVMPYRVVQSGECSIVKESRL